MAKWYVSAKKADFAAIGAKFGIDQVTARIIRNRGVIGDDAVNEFLNGKISDIADPALLKDGQRLVDILVQKIADKAKIRIIGDYDIDGVMSTYILVKALKRAGAWAISSIAAIPLSQVTTVSIPSSYALSIRCTFKP